MDAGKQTSLDLTPTDESAGQPSAAAPATDAQLIQLLRSGSLEQANDALRELSRRYAPLAFATAREILHNTEAARDVQQIFLIKLFCNAHTIDLDRPLSAWTATVAHNDAVSMIRVSERFTSFDGESDILPSKLVVRFTPFDYVAHREILSAIEKLPTRQRVVIERHMIYGEEVKDLAIEFGVTEQAIYTRLKTGKERLRKVLAKRRP